MLISIWRKLLELNSMYSMSHSGDTFRKKAIFTNKLIICI